MKKNILWNILYILIFLMMLAGEVFAVVTVISLDMLPTSFLIALIGVLAVFSVGVGLLLFIKGKGSGKIRRIIASVLAVILICGCTAIGTVATDVMKTLQATSREFFDLPTREIYVLTDNSAQDLKETGGYTYGYLKNYDESCTNQVLDRIRAEAGSHVTTAGYVDIATMVSSLLEGRIDAMILNGGIVSILEDTEEFMDFSAKTRVLEQLRVEEAEQLPVEVTVPAEEEDIYQENTEPTEPVVLDDPRTGEVDYAALEPFVVYVSGSDSHDTEIVKNSRSDVNILAVVNPLTKQILLINTPRDYYVENTAGGYQRDKLTHCGIYGTKCSMNTLGYLYGVDVEYFVRINFSGFKKLIDALGGVTVYSDYAFTAITRTPIAEGENHLNGQQALDFARERVTVPGGDTERGRHQMQVITAVIEKATSGSTIISNYSDIMASVEGMFHMNVPTEMISNLMKMQLSDMARWNVVSYSARGTYSSQECYSAPGLLLSVVEPSYSSVRKASRLIDMVYAGELLTEEVINSIV